MPPKTATKQATAAAEHPPEAFVFRLHEPVQFDADAAGDAPPRFTIAALSGKPLRHWYWGNFSIDLSGMTGKKTVPVLLDHDVSQRLGVSSEREIDPQRGLMMHGTFLKNSPLAAQVRSESKDGFPWEASVRVIPLAIERVSEGVEVEVNGSKLKGPGHVFRRSELREVSFTALGADSNTSAAALSASPELDAEPTSTATLNGDNMPKLKEEEGTGSANAGATVLNEKEIATKAVEAERARGKAIREAAAPEQAQLVEELIVGGAEISAAQAKLAEDLRQRFRQLASRFKEGDKPLSGGNTDTVLKDPRATQLAAIHALPDGNDKWAQLWEFDAKLRETFLRKDDYIALQHVEYAQWKPARIPRLRDENGRPLSLRPWDEVALSVTSPSTPVTIAGVRAGYAASLQSMLGLSWSRTIASAFDTSSPSETYPWLRAVPNPRKWEGERTMQELKSDVVTIVNDDYEATIEFRLPDLRRDKTGQIMARAADLATRVAFFPEHLMTSLLTTNGNAYDSVAFFATTHAVGSSGTINNAIVAGDGLAGGAVPTTAQQSSNILLLLARMLGFLDDQGQPLNEASRQFAIMTPASLYGATVAAINAMFTSASATNPLGELARFGYSFIPVLNARLTATNVFYMFRVDAGIKALLLQEEGVAPVELGPSSEHAAKTNRALFGHGWQGGVGYGRFELAIRGTTS